MATIWRLGVCPANASAWATGAVEPRTESVTCGPPGAGAPELPGVPEPPGVPELPGPSLPGPEPPELAPGEGGSPIPEEEEPPHAVAAAARTRSEQASVERTRLFMGSGSAVDTAERRRKFPAIFRSDRRDEEAL
jgi:hypothetical protein